MIKSFQFFSYAHYTFGLSSRGEFVWNKFSLNFALNFIKFVRVNSRLFIKLPRQRDFIAFQASATHIARHSLSRAFDFNLIRFGQDSLANSLFCLFFRRPPRSARKHRREKIRTINLSFNRCLRSQTFFFSSLLG